MGTSKKSDANSDAPSQDAIKKAIPKKNAGKATRQKLGYWVAGSVALGSCILAGFLAATGGDKVSTPKARAVFTDKKTEPFKASEDVLHIMEGFDGDKDEKLSIDEVRTASAPKMENAIQQLAEQFIGWESGFTKGDADRDGYISPEEIQTLQKRAWRQEGGKPVIDKEMLALAFVLYEANPLPPLPPKEPEETKEKEPEQKEKPKVNVTQAALSSIDEITSSLPEGTEQPVEMTNLKYAIEIGEESLISSALYFLVVQQALDYDKLDGKMVPTVVDFTNTTDPKVHEKMLYAYSYGVKMAQLGYFSIQVLTEVVVNRLASRVNMDGPSFESWLEVKGFMRKDEAETAESKDEAETAESKDEAETAESKIAE